MYTVNAYSHEYYRCIYEEVFTTLNKREIRIYIGALVGTHAAIKIGKKTPNLDFVLGLRVHGSQKS